MTTARVPATGRVRIVLFCQVPSGEPESVIEEAYHRISGDLAGTPGLLGNELLRSLIDDGAFAVMSEWESAEAFKHWDEGPDHKGQTSPLRPYQDPARS
ncbi:antibiotic biosynthesis monooxygenase, partial [Kitasatospora sp. NPDC093558]|uniref:antibiotic biosynthesis monooxygenase family protein n=1 Tax=Kitasatospora sp. NPDC093558 TaxID=3155201 RepID=UPI003417E396